MRSLFNLLMRISISPSAVSAAPIAYVEADPAEFRRHNHRSQSFARPVRKAVEGGRTERGRGLVHSNGHL